MPAALRILRSCFLREPRNLEYAYYVVALSYENDVHPSIYRKDIEHHEANGGNKQSSAVLRAIELIHAGHLVNSIAWIRTALLGAAGQPMTSQIAVRALRWTLMELDARSDDQFCINYLGEIVRAALLYKRFRDAFLLAVESVALRQPTLVAATARTAYALGSPSACHNILANHANLFSRGPVALEGYGLPDDAEDPDLSSRLAIRINIALQKTPDQSSSGRRYLELLNFRRQIQKINERLGRRTGAVSSSI